MKKSTLPVSQKFYTEIRNRISDSFHHYGESLVSKALTTVDTYLFDGQLPDEDDDPSIRLMFSLLRPEIDKAISRSERARRRSAAKRKVSTEETPATDPITDCEDEDSELPPLNRHMRRLIKMECRRATRQRIKPLSGKRQELHE